MAGLLGLSSQTLGSSTSFNWTWFIELATSGILVVWFVFYLNRLFATAVSYGIRTYTWHKFRLYIDIQSLQISLLGGRIFFKDISYYGENETIHIHNGHLTWRYWLPITRQNDLTTKTRKSEDDSSSVDSDFDDDRCDPNAASRGSESRIGISVNGLEWFIYNRTPVYDAIVNQVGARTNSFSDDGAHKTRRGAFAASVVHKLKARRREKPKPGSSAGYASDLDDEADEVSQGLEKGQTTRDTDERDFADDDQQSDNSDDPTYEDAMVGWVHSFVLRFLPVDIDCARGAISLGNEHTRALIVTTFDKASGFIGAAASGPADIYRQTFDFDIEHPVVQMKPNPDYNLPQMASAERIIAGTEAVLKRHPWYKPHLRLRKKRRALVATLRELVPGFRKSVEALPANRLPTHDESTYVPFEQAQPDTADWHGLDRYMDELEGDDHQAWTSIEYARFSTLLDAPSVRVLFFWDTPGTVLDDHIPPIPSGLTKDSNGIEPPAYGLHIDVYGALVHYGPWADRMRAELQGIFLPASYKNVDPKPPLQVGNVRESSLMTISVKIHEEVTLRVPSRETSKDWRWRGRATAVRDAAAMKRQQHKKHFRFRRNAKRRLGPDIRPFGWLAVSVGEGSTVHYVMDMFPGKDGFRNELSLKLKSTKATSSINHAILWTCKEQVVSADLSNPLGWNDLHTWHFSIMNKHMEMFLLRDHTFLLLDLITDFTMGAKSDYMTFVPFEYIIDIDFEHFNLMLNANDCNIIDNPCDLDSNAFLTLAFENLSGRVGVPMKYFSPPQNSVQFKGSGQNASLLLKTPIWNSLRTFSPDETMATLKSLSLDGAYTYLATLTPGASESLVMNIVGGQPRFNLQGFLIRYFMNVKENYFGDHIRFRTLEEYQSRLDTDGRYLGEELQPPAKKSADLDVILSVRADQSCAVMPANIYDRSDNLRVDVMLMEADMRFTSHYMDLQVNSSPVEVSLETQASNDGKEGKNVTRCQLFIDSLAAYGHRLFGAPPTEPAYVCNWDFDVGQISGECSTDFLRILVGAIISFIFTMDDDENALPDTSAVTIPDVTFLRVRTSDLQIWLVTADTAFLVELSPTTVSLNDWANQYFSKCLKISAPKVTVAALESQAAYRQRDLNGQNIPTYACVSTSAKVALLNRKPGFTERRLLQQEHVRTQDLRTNRAPWLLDPSLKLPAVQQQYLNWAREEPAMPVPSMPEPIDLPVESLTSNMQGRSRQLRAQQSSFLESTSLGPRPPLNKAIPSTIGLNNENIEHQNSLPKLRSFATLDQKSGSRSRSSAAFAPNLTLSSAWTKPQFPLHNTRPDLRYMPKAEEVRHYKQGEQEADAWPDEAFEQADEDTKHDGIFCKLSDGILGFCTPQLSGAVVSLLNEIAPHSPNSILDDIERRTISNIKALSSEEPGNIDDLAFKVPFGLIRVVCQHDMSHSPDGYDQYEVSLLKAKATVRLKPYVEEGQRRKHVLTHLSVAEITANVAESLPSQQQFLSAAQLSLGDIGLWLGLGQQIRVRSQIGLVDLASAGRNITSMAGLVQRTQTIVQNVMSEVDGFRLTSNQQHFVYHLTLQHQAMDPAFLNRPAYVLRTARNHVRMNDSWKIISRLRNNWNTMRQSQAHTNFCDDRCHVNESQDESKRHILSSFNQWKAWEGTNLDDSAVVQAIFGLNEKHHPSPELYHDTEVELLLGRLMLTLDPGPRQTQIAVQNIDLNVGDKTVLAHKSGWSFQKQFKRQQTIQLYCGNAAVHVDWELLEFANRLIETLPLPSAPEVPRTADTDMNVALHADHDLTIIVGADMVSLSAKTPNLSLLIGAEIFRTSFLIRETAYRQHELTVMLSSSAGRLRLYGLKKSVLGIKITLPNVYVGYKQGHKQSVSSSSVYVAATSQQIRLHVKRDVLQLLKVADAVIGQEVPNVQALVDSLPKHQSMQQQPKQDASTHLPQLHMALFLNNYRMEFAILPYLRYVISGKTARTSIVPHDSSRLSIHVDLKENEHAFTDQKNRNQAYKSFLSMPPVNLRLGVQMSPDEVLLDSHGTLELIKLEASAVRACFDAVYKPQTTAYIKEVKAQIQTIQISVKEQFKPTGPVQHETAPSPAHSIRKVRYRVQAMIAGVAIHCTAPPLRERQRYGSDLSLSVGPTSLRLHNEQPASHELYKKPQFVFVLSEVSLGVFQASPQQINFGLFRMGLSISGRSEMDKEHNEVQHYRAVSNGITLDLYAETALLVVDIVTFLQERIKNLALSENTKNMRPLRRLTIAVADPNKRLINDDSLLQQNETPPSSEDDGQESSLFDSTFAIDINAICARWYVSDHAIYASEEAAESMAFTIRKIDLRTKREGTARLAIADLQLQLIPSGHHDPMQRTANSALLPEMIFNAAYVKTSKTRKWAFKAAGKAVNIMLAADFILPINAVQKSLARASNELRSLKMSVAESSPDTAPPQLPKLLGTKRLASLLIYADFAGAEVSISQKQNDSPASAFGILKGTRRSRAGKYGQAVQSGSNQEATLRAPGIALRISYLDNGIDNPSLSTELKVAASSNTLAPSVVPLIQEISSSVSEMIGQENSSAKQPPAEKPAASTKAPATNGIDIGDPTAILGRVKFNGGLWVQQQEFSLTCQPIARVSATAKFDEIFVTVNTVEGTDHDRFFSIMTTFRNLSASVQHVYSRESTASFHVDSIVVSFMNSKHFSNKSGISAILEISPMKADLNAKQMQDFMLFREIWYPEELRASPKAPDTTLDAVASSQAALQRYQMTANASMPWHAIVSVQELRLTVDFGQSIGHSSFIVSKLWASSQKNSDSEQNLCVGFQRVGIESTGRMSGFVELQGFRVRTAIRWPVEDEGKQTPLVQGSVGFEHLRAQVAFDYQPFMVADISSFQFLMYNVRQGSSSDRLVGILDGGKIQVFCTTMTAAQGLSIFQAFERLVQEKQEAYESSLHELDRYLRRKSVMHTSIAVATSTEEKAASIRSHHAPQLQVDVVIMLRAIDAGVFPSTFVDETVLKLEAVDVQARFAVGDSMNKTHSGLGMSLGQVRVALSSTSKPSANAIREVSIDEVIERATTARGGTILKVPRLVASMETWQQAQSNIIEYIFSSTFQGKVDVGWNYSRISQIRRMWELHSKAFAQRLGKPLPPSAVKITAEAKDDDGGQEKITAVINMPQSKYDYVALEPPIIDTPQLRDLGDATPSLEWIGLHRDRLPHVTHSVIIVSLLELAKEVEDSYGRILGAN